MSSSPTLISGASRAALPSAAISACTGGAVTAGVGIIFGTAAGSARGRLQHMKVLRESDHAALPAAACREACDS